MTDRRVSSLLNGILGRIIARVTGTGFLTFVATLTADRTATFPDATGTVALLSQAQTFTANQRVNTNGTAFPFTYATSPFSLQGVDDTEWNTFYHGYYSLGAINSGVNASFRMARGTAAAPAAIQSGDHFGGLLFGAHNGTTWVDAGRIGYQARETHTAITAATRLFLQTTDTGSTTVTSRIYVEPDGSVVINPITSSTESKTNGRLQVNNAGAGAATYAARWINSGTGANTAVRMSLDPGNSGAGVRDAIIEAVNNGSTAITLRFLVANGAAPVTALTIAPDLGITTAGANYVKTRSVSASAGTTVLDATDDTAILTGATTHTFTLPAAAAGRRLFFKNRSSGALTVNRAGADTIDGGTTLSVAAGAAKILIANGTDWCAWNA